MNTTDDVLMAKAIELARLGTLTTQPNPRVGCVIVKDGVIVGSGYHRKAGFPHAERYALAMAGNNSVGATCYVTLEPCSHTGRTSPCADALINAGVARVVVAMTDPNPQVAGTGIEKLRNAGISVTTGVAEAEAKALNPGFIKRMLTGKPWVRVKLAMSLDGKTAMLDGESKWLTGELARQDVQYWRARSSAIITGRETVSRDNPSLNVRWSLLDTQTDHMRHENEVISLQHQPDRIIVDSQAKTTTDINMLTLPGKTVLATTSKNLQKQQAWQAAGGEWLSLPAHNSHLDLSALLQHLGQQHCNEVLIESGPQLTGAFTSLNLVDEFLIYIAPKLLGNHSLNLMNLPGIHQLSEHIPLMFNDISHVGTDLRIRAVPLKN